MMQRLPDCRVLSPVLTIVLFCSTAWANLSGAPVFNVREYGAIGDGITKDTAALQEAIDACAESGGGTVFFPHGVYLTGSLHLKSNVTLYLDNGATVRASEDNDDFDPYETLDFENDADHETTYFHYSLIWGEDIENVSIEGPGTIDGNRNKRGGPKPFALKRCRFITVRDVTILNAPNYCISLLGCDYVNIDGVTILNAYCDGIDPDSCKHVRISNCHIESWDDAIVLKSSFALGERRATEYVTVTNCVLSTSSNALKLGTESGGGFRYVTASNLVMFGPAARATRSGVAIESVDGAVLEGIAVSNVSMQDVNTPIFIRLGNRGRDMETPIPGKLRDVAISNITATGSTQACSITGLPGHPVENVSIDQVNIQYQGGGKANVALQDVPELPAEYPEAKMFGELPAYGLYCRHVKNLTLRDLQLRYAAPDERPAWVCDDVVDLQSSGLIAESAGKHPVILFHNVQHAQIGLAPVPTGAETYLRLSGEKTADIFHTGMNFHNISHPLTSAPEVRAGALRPLR